MVALVPITPIRLLNDTDSAFSMAGVITSKIGTGNSACRRSEATLAAVLQAMMIIFAPLLSRNSVSCRAYLHMVSGAFRTIGGARQITEIDQILFRQKLFNRLCHGHAANT